MKKEKNGTNRAIIAGLGFAFQIFWILSGVYALNIWYPKLDIVLRVLSILLIFRILGKHTNSAIKIPWIIGILVAPVAGLILYALLGSRFTSISIRRRFKYIYGMADGVLQRDRELMSRLKNIDSDVYGHVNYIDKYGNYPAYSNDDVVYFSEASDAIEKLKEELENAQKFIFMEYHAIEDAGSFRAIEDILKRKADEGLDIRVIYDDVGSLGFVDRPFSKRLNKEGIKCRVFNPVIPIVNIFMNNRDHRKITVIDGKVGFTGGYNIADEYFNIVNPFGYWKDTGIMIKGRSVDNLTMIFLEMWHAMRRNKSERESLENLINQYDMCNISYDVLNEKDLLEDDIEDKLVDTKGEDKIVDTKGEDKIVDTKGEPIDTQDKTVAIENKESSVTKSKNKLRILQPFAENPLYEEQVAENVYLNLAKTSNDYLYITTPYLIIDDIMRDELTLAAKRGVDVRIITPGIPDKKIIYAITRSNYANLARNGVKIYEYSPGFVHAKQHISDDKCGVIGTINMDYRSLYLHFENGVYIYDEDLVKEMRIDMENMFAQSEDVTSKYSGRRSMRTRIWHGVLRFISPLL